MFTLFPLQFLFVYPPQFSPCHIPHFQTNMKSHIVITYDITNMISLYTSLH